MAFRLSTNLTRITLLVGLGMALGASACEPMFRPKTFTDYVFNEDGERETVKNAAGEAKLDSHGRPIYKTQEVSEVKFAEGALTVSAEKLNKGKETYRAHCMQCHGMHGEGDGWSSVGLIPPPRNFAASFIVFKFAHVQANMVPNDEDLKRTLRNGLHGTAMLPWGLNEERLDEVLQYIKTFSKRWRDEKPSEAITLAPDPFGPAKAAEAIEKGKVLFHTKFECAQCHPAYVSQDEINQFLKAEGKPAKTPRPDAHWSVAKSSDAYKVNITPPDFTWHDLRSVHKPKDASAAEVSKRLETLYFAIAMGIGGTAMPTWKNAQIPERDGEIWAVAYYVSSLIDLRSDEAKRTAFWSKLRGQN